MKIKTATLTGKALDWALADAFGLRPEVCYGAVVGVQDSTGCWHDFKGYEDPATCMGLTSQINIMQQATDGSWRVAAFCKKGKKHKAHGATLAEAVARCVVQMRLGDEVEVPDELCGVQP